MKNRTVLGMVCILFAFAISFGVAPIINKTASAKIDIIRMTNNISQGTKITENDVQIISVGAYNIPANVVKNKDEIIGKFAACDLKIDDYVLPSKISDSADSANDIFRTLNGSKNAMSITINSFAGGLSGKLRNGDIVTIIVTGKNPDNPADIPAQLKYVRVITATTTSGFDVDSSDGENSEIPATVTLLVNEEQAKLLTEYENHAVIHLSLVYRGNEETANQFLAVQEQFFKERNTLENE